MKNSSERTSQVVILILAALAAVTITIYALVTVSPADRFKAPTLVTYAPTSTQPGLQTYTLEPYSSNTPDQGLGIAPTNSAIPSRFPATPSATMLMPAPLELTNIHIFVVTARIATQRFMLTEYVQATKFMRSVQLEKTRRANAPCYCYADVLSCSNFPTRTSAQFCFNYCVREGMGDIHFLDEDYDGIACEKNND